MKHIKILFSIFCFIIIIFHINISNASIEEFPDTYKPYLIELKNKHPNWSFIPVRINLDWNYVINNENVFGTNLVPLSYSDRWKNTKPGQYNVEVDAGWVDCSRRALEYTMDPRNFLNEVRIFQFEGLSYVEYTNNIEGIEKILYGTEFYNRTVQYYDSYGNNITMNARYSDLILSAARTSGVSSYHLASRIKQEVGPFLSHASISGTVSGYEGLYNFYNIGATSSAEPMGAIKNGLQYARDGKGASQEIKNRYWIPWNTKERAITGGAIFIGSSYISRGQDTVYLQKFHVRDYYSSDLFWHQYMTNVLAPYSESVGIYKGYSNTGMLDNTIAFIIPIYNNMPDTPVENPNILESDFLPDNTNVYADVTNTLNIRTGPSISYETLTSIDRNVVMKRIAKGNQSGELWDKVLLPSGIVGYAFSGYLKEVPEKQIESINLSIDNNIITKGETKKLNVKILPEEAQDHEVLYTSSNPNVAYINSNGDILAISSGTSTITVKAKENEVSAQIEIQIYSPVTDMRLNVDSLMLQVGESFILNPVIIPTDASNKNVIYTSSNDTVVTCDPLGNITAIGEGNAQIIAKAQDADISKIVNITVVPKLGENEVIFNESLRLDGNRISGFDVTNLNVENVISKIDTVYNIEIYNHKGERLNATNLCGTGSMIRLVDENGIVKMEYKIIIYGDVNGDGKINTVDLLVLQRHILEIEKLQNDFLISGNISKNGKNPTSLDLLLIQRHILGLKLILQ